MSRRPVGALACCCCALLAAQARAQLVMTLHNNTALGLPVEATTRVSSLPGPLKAGPLQSAEALGSLALPTDGGTVAFAAVSDGTVRVWVDDHLVLDDAVSVAPGTPAPPPRRISTWITFPQGYAPAKGGARVPVRVEYTRPFGPGDGTPAEGHLELQWEVGGGGGFVTVPAAAFSPDLTPAQTEREALRHRLYEPEVPWQTYAITSLSAHTLCPTGLVVRLTLHDAVTGDTLGDVRPFQRFDPAHVLPGLRSINGSVYTSLTVQRWIGGLGSMRNASVFLETATATPSGQPCNGTRGSGGARCDLLVRAACKGSACPSIAVAAYAGYSWGRVGTLPSRVLPAGGGSAVGGGGSWRVGSRRASNATAPPVAIAAQPAGFDEVSIHVVLAAEAAVTTLRGIEGDVIVARFGGGTSGGVAFSTGEAWSLHSLDAVVSAARARATRVPPAVENSNTTALFLPMRDVLAWNTVFTHALHVYTPVARNWAQNDDTVSTFVWDVFFAAIMLVTDVGSERARDIAHANVITTMFSRTVTGMVPNYRTGKTCTYDRTEPMLGSWTLQILHDVLGSESTWVVELLFPVLEGWNAWTWRRRRAEGVLATSDGASNLIALGSDAATPPGLNTPHTLAAARYESGLDNSPMYDGNDHPAGEGMGVGPVRFNATTSHMKLYDIAYSVYHALDSTSLASLAELVNQSNAAPALRARAATVSAAINKGLFDPESQQYCNRLDNGTFYCRHSPTAFAPMLLPGLVPPDRLTRQLELLGSPAMFCVHDDLTGGASKPATALLWRMSATGRIAPSGASVTCATDRCLKATVLAGAQFEAIEAVVAVNSSASSFGKSGLPEGSSNKVGDAGDTVPLEWWSSALGGDGALVTPSVTLPVGYARVGVEGWCSPTPGPASARRVALSLWRGNESKPAGSLYCTCGGSAACNASAMGAAGYDLVNEAMCYAYPASRPEDLPCKIALPSMARNDTSFWDQLYWRGRQWAPQTFLVWAGLRQHCDAPEAAAAANTLVAKASAQFRQELDLFGQVNENMNGVLGCGSDSPRADSYYHWGALNAFCAIAQAGAYPSRTLLGPHQCGAGHAAKQE